MNFPSVNSIAELGKGFLGDKTMRRFVKMLVVAAVVIGFAGSANAVTKTLDTLINGTNPGDNVLVSGDKLFANFSWSGPTPPLLTGINISSIGSGNVGDLFGIEIQAGFALLGPGPATSDWALHYSVTVIPSGVLISDIHQLLIGAATANGQAVVTETATATQNGGVVASATSTLASGSSQTSFDLVVPNLRTVWISKDIQFILNANAGSGDSVTASIIDQRFSQTAVPDGGSTLILLGTAFSGLAWLNLRRKKGAL